MEKKNWIRSLVPTLLDFRVCVLLSFSGPQFPSGNVTFCEILSSANILWCCSQEQKEGNILPFGGRLVIWRSPILPTSHSPVEYLRENKTHAVRFPKGILDLNNPKNPFPILPSQTTNPLPVGFPLTQAEFFLFAFNSPQSVLPKNTSHYFINISLVVESRLEWTRMTAPWWKRLCLNHFSVLRIHGSTWCIVGLQKNKC